MHLSILIDSQALTFPSEAPDDDLTTLYKRYHIRAQALESKKYGFQPKLFELLAIYSWETKLNSLILSFFIIKERKVVLRIK